MNSKTTYEYSVFCHNFQTNRSSDKESEPRRTLFLPVPVVLAVAALTFYTQPAVASDFAKTQSAIEIVVAQDGSGQFTSVQDAIMSVPSGSASKPVVIHIKPGTYKELIYIQHEKRFFHLVGASADKTVLT